MRSCSLSHILRNEALLSFSLESDAPFWLPLPPTFLGTQHQPQEELPHPQGAPAPTQAPRDPHWDKNLPHPCPGAGCSWAATLSIPTLPLHAPSLRYHYFCNTIIYVA